MLQLQHVSTLRFIFTVAALAGITACSAATNAPPGGTGGAGGGSSSSSSGSGGDVSLFDGGTGDGGQNARCSEAAKLIYLLGAEGVLYSFHPPTMKFTSIGALSCPASPGATPYSMAVDRDAIAWVLYDDGRLFRVDTADASCTATSFASGQTPNEVFGMGFVTDGAGSDTEKLYVADVGGTGIGTIDTKTLTYTKIGSYDHIFESAELTGTGAGKLFGYFTTAPPIVAELDPKTAKVLSQAPQPSVEIGKAWAFAFWGGDFYLFSCPGIKSRVDRYRPSDGTTVSLQANVGITVVGAGVSTCAPIEPPK